MSSKQKSWSRPIRFWTAKKMELRWQSASLSEFFQNYKKNTKPFAIALVGFSKAFDSVSHNAKMSTFELIYQISTNMAYRLHQGPLRWKLYNLRLRTNTSKKKDTTRGSFKSTSLQPCTRWSSAYGSFEHLIQRKRLNTIAYADDLLIAAKDLRFLQMVLQRVEDEAEKLGISINAKKSKLISCLSVPKEKKIICRIKDQLVSKAGVIRQLEFNKTVRYLGVDFNRHGVKTWNTFGK